MTGGFTLVEVLVTLVIAVFILGGVIFVLYLADLTWEIDSSLVELQQGVRLAMDGISREIRQGNPANVTVGSSLDRLDFYMPDVPDAISYYVLNNQVIREHPAGVTKILASNISNMTFCCLGGANCTDCSHARMVEAQVSADKAARGKQLTFSLNDKVKLRNE